MAAGTRHRWPGVPLALLSSALFGVSTPLAKRHQHEHAHGLQAHEHRHAHAPDDPPGEPHVHWHRHAPLRHEHPHYPDLHHRHGHH